MRLRGILRALLRERRPLAVLAILAALLPSVLAGAASPGLRLADGSLVICTDDGFQRIADPGAAGDHDLRDCCIAGCIHAGQRLATGPAPVSGPVRLAVADAVAWPAWSASAHADPAASSLAIRAPPARSA